jgi:hypothetical protein
MPNPAIYYANPSAWSLTASAGSRAGYPITNLQDFLRASRWMGADSVAQSLDVELPAVAACDYCIIEYGDGLNPADVGWTDLKIEAADNAAFTVNKIEVFDGDMESGVYLVDFGYAYTKRYWRVGIGGAVTDFPGIANLFLGKALKFSFPYEFGAKQGDSSFQSVVGRSLSGVKRSSQAVGGTRVFDIAFSLISDAVAAEFQTFHDVVRGDLRPFYYSPDGGTTLYYVSLTKGYNPIVQYRPGLNNIQQISMETADSEVV